MTRAEALTDAYKRLVDAGVPAAEARLESRILLRHATGLSREELFLRPNVALTNTESERFAAIIDRRADREPLAYITGTRDFYGLTFAVTPDVLIPRPETEGVVEAVIALSHGALTSGASPSSEGEAPGEKTPRILDLCTGSGCIAVAVAVHASGARVTATDISTNALAVARGNAERLGVRERVTCLEGDLFAPIASETRFDVIASNPPYIAPEEIERLEPEVRAYEPRIALGVHLDDLHFYRRIASEAPAYLAEGGGVVVEVGQGQADAVRGLFYGVGFTDVTILPDLAGTPRVVVAKVRRDP